MHIPYFDEKQCKFSPEKDKIIDPNKTPLIIIDGFLFSKIKKLESYSI